MLSFEKGELCSFSNVLWRNSYEVCSSCLLLSSYSFEERYMSPCRPCNDVQHGWIVETCHEDNFWSCVRLHMEQ